MPRLTFTIQSEVSAHDSKTTVPRVKFMQFTPDGPFYAFPPELQDKDLHTDLFDSTAGKLAKAAVKIRGTSAPVNVTFTSEVYAKYVDDDENPVFRNTLLRIWVPPPRPTVYSSTSSSSSTCADGPPAHFQPQPPREKSLASIAKEIVLEKFGTRRVNASSWLDMFESECLRVELSQEKFWQIIRLFLEGYALEWYDSCRQTIDHDRWELWRDSFLDSFSDKGWSAARAAFSFHFIAGSLSEYAIKKQNLLINLHRNIDDVMTTYHIVTGLPLSVQEKLDRSEITSTRELLRKLNALDRPARSNSNSFNTEKPNSFTPRNSFQFQSKAFNTIRPKSFCNYCLKKGKELPHVEENCRNKAWDLANGKLFNSNKGATSNVNFKPKTDKPAVNNLELDEDFLAEVESASKNA